MQLNRIAGRVACAGLVSLIAFGAVIQAVHADPAGAVSIVNGTRTAMVSLQLRPSGTEDWQANVLQHRTLGVARAESVGLSGSTCLYDLFCRFEDGHRQVKTHVNLCRSKLVVSDY